MDALWRRVAITGFVGLSWRGLTLIPIPGVEVGVGELSPALDRSMFSVGTLGLVSWTSAALCVEFVCASVPPLRRFRFGDPRARAKVARATDVVALCFAAVQAYALALGMEAIRAPDVVANPGLAFQLGSVAAVLAGSLSARVGAAIIDRSGLGQGFALALLVASVEPIRASLAAVSSRADEALVPLLVLVLLSALGVRWLGRTTGAGVPWLAVGVVPLASTPLVRALVPDAWPRVAVAVLAAMALAEAYLRLFYPPEAVARTTGSTPAAVVAARDQARPTTVLWAAAAAAVLAGPWLDGVPVDFIGTAVVAALAWEVIVEWQDRAQVYAATAARARLEAAGITTTTRGQTYRRVTQFFGALVPIEILVLPDDTARAQAILAEPPLGAVAPAPRAAPLAPPPDPTNPWSG